MKRGVFWIVAAGFVFMASSCEKMPVRGDLEIVMTAIRLDGVPYTTIGEATYEVVAGSTLEIEYSFEAPGELDTFWYGESPELLYPEYAVEPGESGVSSGTILIEIPVDEYMTEETMTFLDTRAWRIYGLTEDGTTTTFSITLKKVS